MSGPAKVVEQGGKRVEVWLDEDAESPREWDNLGILLLEHQRYALPYEDEDAARCSGDVDEHEAELRAHYGSDLLALLPVWGYDHGDLAIKAGDRTGQFADSWDSGQLGFAVALKSRFDPEGIWAVKDACDALVQEVETFDQWGRGQVYGFKAFAPALLGGGWTETDSCWGFYGVEEALREAGIQEEV